MCTVVCRFAPEEHYPVQMLALRDERATRAFDPPGAWWPGQPSVIGGRDRTAGGSWCVTSVPDGLTAVVLNRPERREAAPGASSRGVLPLLAAQHGTAWHEHVDLDGMASFNLVLADPSAMQWWCFDGQALRHDRLPAGTVMFTPRGLAQTMDPRLAAGRARTDAVASGDTAAVWPEWLDVVRSTAPSADPAGFVVRVPIEADTFETVFGQFIAARPGQLRLDYLSRLAALGADREWTRELITRPVGR